MNASTKEQPKCSDRIAAEWASTRATLADLIAVYESGEESWQDMSRKQRAEVCEKTGRSVFAIRRDNEIEGNLYEYGLSFDYVAPETFNDQPEGYWRHQLSWGGPSDEIRFYASRPDSPCYRVEYWFLDWWDGASLDLTRDDICQWLWDWFQEAGSVQAEYDKAGEE